MVRGTRKEIFDLSEAARLDCGGGSYGWYTAITDPDMRDIGLWIESGMHDPDDEYNRTLKTQLSGAIKKKENKPRVLGRESMKISDSETEEM